MPSLHDAEDLAGRASRARRAIAARISAFVARHAIYRRLFLMADGSLSADSETLLRELAAFAFADRPSRPTDVLPLERIEGRRDMYFRLTAALKLDGARLASMQLQFRESGDE